MYRILFLRDLHFLKETLKIRELNCTSLLLSSLASRLEICFVSSDIMSFLKAMRRKAIIYLCGFCFLAFVIAFVWCTSPPRFKNTVCNIRQKDAESQSLGTASLPVSWRESPPLGPGSQRNEEGSAKFSFLLLIPVDCLLNLQAEVRLVWALCLVRSSVSPAWDLSAFCVL